MKAAAKASPARPPQQKRTAVDVELGSQPLLKEAEVVVNGKKLAGIKEAPKPTPPLPPQPNVNAELAQDLKTELYYIRNARSFKCCCSFSNLCTPERWLVLCVMLLVTAWMTFAAATVYSHRAEDATPSQWYHFVPVALMTLGLCFTIGYRPPSMNTSHAFSMWANSDGEMDQAHMARSIWLIVICVFTFGGFGSGILMAMVDFLSPVHKTTTANVTTTDQTNSNDYDIWTGQLLVAVVFQMLLSLAARWKQILTQQQQQQNE